MILNFYKVPIPKLLLKGVILLQYVNDFVLFCLGKYPRKLRAIINEQFSIFKIWFEDKNFENSIEKSNSLLFSKKEANRNRGPLVVKYGDEVINNLTSVKYRDYYD